MPNAGPQHLAYLKAGRIYSHELDEASEKYLMYVLSDSYTMITPNSVHHHRVFIVVFLTVGFCGTPH